MNFKDTFIIFCRSMFLQAGWNYLRFQGFGLAFVMLPFLKKFYSGNNLDIVLLRYMESFNTHPVMAAFAYGALARAEETVAVNPPQSAQWRVVKTFLSSSLASVGDRLFWDVLRPLSLIVGVFLSFVMVSQGRVFGVGVEAPNKTVFLIAAAVLVIYNIFAFWAKWIGIKISYSGTRDNTFGLLNFNWNAFIKLGKVIGFIITVFFGVCVFYLNFTVYSLSPQFFVYLSMILLIFVVSGFASKYDIPNVYIYLLLTLIVSTAVYFI